MNQRVRMNQIRHAFNRYRSSAWPMHFAAVEQTLSLCLPTYAAFVGQLHPFTLVRSVCNK